MSRLRFWRRHDEIPVVELRRSNPVRVGVVFLVLLVIAVYFGFTKHIPFKHGFRLKAVFATAVNIHPKSPVRIAGVDVGTGHLDPARGQRRPGEHGNRTERPADPLRRDAEDPPAASSWKATGSSNCSRAPPRRRRSPRAHTIPITQTADPVQLDQVLDALNTDTRANLQNFLQGYGDGLTRKPDAAENAEQDPEVHGLTAAAGAEPDLPSRPRRRCAARRSSTGDRRHRTARPLRADRGDRQSDGGAERARAGARANGSPTSTPSSRSFAAQSPSLSATIARAAGRAAQRQHRRSPSLRRRASRRRAPSPTRILPGVKQHESDGQRRAAVDRTGAGLARAERARRRRQGPGRSGADARPAASANRCRSTSRPTCSASA